MSVHPHPLAAQFAILRAATQADADRSWLPNALNTLILACLARVFASLERLVLL